MKCSRCGSHATFTAVMRAPTFRKEWAFCPLHAERLEYIINCYINAPPHKVKP